LIYPLRRLIAQSDPLATASGSVPNSQQIKHHFIDTVEVSNKSERSLTLAGKSTELPADVALDTNREHDLEKRTESEAGKLDDELNANQQLTDWRSEPTPQESIISNPLTPSKAELMRPDENAPVKNKLQGYRRLNRAK
jgi:hypothetical protein